MIYLLSGENTYETERQLQEFVTKFDGEVERYDGSELTLEMLPDLFMGVTLFASSRLIIIKNVSSQKSIWNALDEWLEKADGTDVVLVEPKPDKRTKTYKWLQKHAEVSESRELQPYEAEQWLMKTASVQGLLLQQDLARFWVEYIGTDQWRLQNELEKVRLSKREPNQALLRELAEPTPQATSFEVLEAAFAGRRDQLEQLLTVVARSEDPFMFLGLLSSQVYAIALMQTDIHARPDEVAKTVGIHPFVLKKVTPLARTLDQAQLQRLVRQLADLDTHLKSRAVEPWEQIRSVLVALRT